MSKIDASRYYCTQNYLFSVSGTCTESYLRCRVHPSKRHPSTDPSADGRFYDCFEVPYDCILTSLKLVPGTTLGCTVWMQHYDDFEKNRFIKQDVLSIHSFEKMVIGTFEYELKKGDNISFFLSGKAVDPRLMVSLSRVNPEEKEIIKDFDFIKELRKVCE